MPDARERTFQTTSERGLDRTLLPMRLFAKAKRHGIWNPEDLDFRRDREDFATLDELERDVLLRLTSLFQAGEESVTLDLLPLIRVVAREGRLEEEIYLTSFLWEEAKHVDLFRRFLDEVAGSPGNLSGYHSASYRQIFYDELPRSLARLDEDPSPVAQAEASVTYNMIVEGILAETGYQGYRRILVEHGIMPGMQEGVGHLERDESRHLAYGVHLLSRLVAEHGDPVWHAIEGRMGELLTPAIGIIHETFVPYETPPFGLSVEMFTEFAMAQFQRRMARIEKARGRHPDDVARDAAEGA